MIEVVMTPECEAKAINHNMEAAKYMADLIRERDALRAKLAAVEAERDVWKEQAESDTGIISRQHDHVVKLGAHIARLEKAVRLAQEYTSFMNDEDKGIVDDAVCALLAGEGGHESSTSYRQV